MGKTSIILILVLLNSNVFAQAPQKMSYQAVIRNSDDALITNTQVGIRISILQATITGTAVYVETQLPTSNTNGLLSIEIGSGTVVSGNFSAIDWSEGPYFIKTEIDPAGGSNYLIIGTSELLSVPYALHALIADKIKQDVASKADVDELNNQFLLMKEMLIDEGIYKIKDINGNNYHIKRIGTQVWMTENLRTNKYNDNTPIPFIRDSTTWGIVTTPGYGWYRNDSATYSIPYGALYNWYTVNIGKLCPTGWHVPTNADWTFLINYLGGENVAGGKLKESGTEHWNSATPGATNESGFSAVPGGMSYWEGFEQIGVAAYYWSASKYDTQMAWYYLIDISHDIISKGGNLLGIGTSVRCLKN